MPDTRTVFFGLVARAQILGILALAFMAVPSRAIAGSEALAFGSEQAFVNAAFLQPRPTASRFRSVAFVQPSGESMLGGAAKVGDIPLSISLNGQLKSALKYNLGGKDVWVSGAFDRQQNAYVSILVDGCDAVFFNLKGLVDRTERITIGTAKYKLYLVRNVISQKKSEVILEDSANSDEKILITLRRLLEAVDAGGAPVLVAGQNYKVFYTDDIKAGQADKTAKCFTFILTDVNGDIHVFPIPAELVPSGTMALFTLFAGARVGLLQKDGKLKIYDYP